MALIGPILDDRTFEQLRAELIERISVYAPEWTDHNAGDPGIALLDLFAFLGESLLFRFNQIPDATKTAFLRLLGVPTLPPLPASVLVVAETERPGGVPILAGAELRAGSISFETRGEVVVWPLEAVGLAKIAVAEPGAGLTDSQRRREVDRRRDAADRLEIPDGAQVQYYASTTLPSSPDLTAPALDVASTVDRALWIALLARPTTDARLLEGRTISVGVALDDTVDETFRLEALDATAAEGFRSTGLDEDLPVALWRLWTPTAGSSDPADPGSLQKLDVARDTTEGLTATGVVELTVPTPLPAPIAAPTGVHGSPPPFDDPELTDRVVAWLQVARPDTESRPIGRVRWVGANAVDADQARTAALELLGAGTGESGQVYDLQQTGILPGTALVEVEEAGRWRAWEEVENFLGTGDGDRHFVLDAADGQVRFGPGGRQGRVPQLGERVRVRAYRHGGGSAGNVAVGAVSAAPGTAGVKVANPLPGRGGRDAEALDAALDRIPAEVHRRDRAVTADDFRELAEQVPGVVRAETLPLLHPDTPGQVAAGVVSVMIFPVEDARDPAAPTPDRGLLRRVARYLDPRRLVTTELYVIPPEYRRIVVAAGVVVREGYQVDAVRRWVELILRQYLAPVPPFGPAGRGWPLGRAVRRAELEAVAVQVEGVEYLEGLRLATVDPGTTTPPVEVDLVPLTDWQVPALAEATVVQGPALPPGDGYRVTSASTPAGTPIVPLPREVC